MEPTQIIEEKKSCNHDWIQKPATLRGYQMNAICKRCEEIKKNIFPVTTFEGFIRRWVHGKLKDRTSSGRTITQSTCGKYKINKDGKEIYYYGTGRKVREPGKDTLAIELPDGRKIGNASKLKRCGSYRRSSEAPAQQVMQQLEMPLVPFNVFEEAKMDLFKTEVVCQGPAEELLLPKLFWSEINKDLRPVDIWAQKNSVERPKKSLIVKNIEKGEFWIEGKERKGYRFLELKKGNLEKRHFIGAMIIKIGEKYFLFDVDRREIEHYNFNAFLSELPNPCKTIMEAYNALMPKEVKAAIKRGLKVERQGEWFFIPYKLPKPVKASWKAKKLTEKEPSLEAFDLDYPHFSIRRDGWQITKENIEANLKVSGMKKKYENDHLQRVKDFNAYAKKYMKAIRECNRENPNKHADEGILTAGSNSPNCVEMYIELPEGVFVSGEVTHTGRQHEPLKLRGWYKPVPNTAVQSFTIRGNID